MGRSWEERRRETNARYYDKRKAQKQQQGQQRNPNDIDVEDPFAV